MAKRWERFRVSGDELLKRVRALIEEGNVRRVVVKQGARTIVEFPVTVGGWWAPWPRRFWPRWAPSRPS